MCDKKTDRTSLRRQAQRKESYANLLSKRKRMLRMRHDQPNKKLRLGTIKNFDTLRILNRKKEDEKGAREDNIASTSRALVSHRPHFKLHSTTTTNQVQPNTVQSEIEVSSVITRSVSKRYASVGAIHQRVDWMQQLKVRKQWPVDVAYCIEGPLAQHTELRELLSRSLTEVMMFCKNAWSVHHEVQLVNGDESVVVGEQSDFLDAQEEDIDENENHTPLQLQEENIIELEDEDHGDTFYDQPDDDEQYQTVALYPDEAFVIDDERPSCCVVDQYNTVAAVLSDHNYAQKCDYIPVKKLDLEHFENYDREEKGFALENALNDLLLNTAILKCLVCGESPEDVITLLDSAQC